LYGGKGRQITWQARVPHTGGNRGGGNMFSRGGNQMGPRRDPNAIDIDRGREGDRTCYYCGKFGHMAQNCWKRNKARVVETLMGDLRELDLETRVITNRNSKSPRCFTVVR